MGSAETIPDAVQDAQEQLNYELLLVSKNRGEGVEFERTRRITGYLVGALNRFNNAKRAEEKDRVKHDANS